jgi:FKBP-type peptidyl-prolyl cis-trans isomerase 2
MSSAYFYELGDKMAVEKGNKVKVDYTGTLEDGTVFDTSDGKQPLEYESGSGQLIKGFDSAVVGMEKGEEKEITLKPEESYGEHNPQMIQKLPREQLPKDKEPKKGMALMLKSPDGKQFPARIAEVTDKEVELDLNHPLAGKTLKFKIKVLDITA